MGNDATVRADYDRIHEDAVRLAGGPSDIPQRVAILHSIFVNSGGNHAFPEVALHGALWAYAFYERRGVVSRLINYRYFYDREERARRAYMLYGFSQGFKQANRSVFVDTYTNYQFSKHFGAAEGAANRVLEREWMEAEELTKLSDIALAGIPEVKPKNWSRASESSIAAASMLSRTRTGPNRRSSYGQQRASQMAQRLYASAGDLDGRGLPAQLAGPGRPRPQSRGSGSA